jgi:hypothetical protein
VGQDRRQNIYTKVRIISGDLKPNIKKLNRK